MQQKAKVEPEEEPQRDETTSLWKPLDIGVPVEASKHGLDDSEGMLMLMRLKLERVSAKFASSAAWNRAAGPDPAMP